MQPKKPNAKHREPTNCGSSQSTQSKTPTEKQPTNQTGSSITAKVSINDQPITIRDKLPSSELIELKFKECPKDIIKQLFLVEMPDDFYSFWEMCKTLNEKDPSSK